jgi:hypothetical protein
MEKFETLLVFEHVREGQQEHIGVEELQAFLHTCL